MLRPAFFNPDRVANDWTATLCRRSKTAPTRLITIEGVPMAKDQFTVTVSRINESANQAPYETLSGHTLKISPDGTLSIEGQNGGRSFSGGLWDSFEVKMLPWEQRK